MAVFYRVGDWYCQKLPAHRPQAPLLLRGDGPVRPAISAWRQRGSARPVIPRCLLLRRPPSWSALRSNTRLESAVLSPTFAILLRQAGLSFRLPGKGQKDYLCPYLAPIQSDRKTAGCRRRHWLVAPPGIDRPVVPT